MYFTTNRERDKLSIPIEFYTEEELNNNTQTSITVEEGQSQNGQDDGQDNDQPDQQANDNSTASLSSIQQLFSTPEETKEEN